jgi:phosphoglucosamine mutase|tara:strand:- start:5179 stop:6444 length:1266 start_codon:yes stop_codon:yes gene_type:complete
MRLAHAVGRVLKSAQEPSDLNPKVLIGKDTRISGYMLESAMESGFNSAGVDVVLLGPIPTPAVAYLTRAQRASLGVVISASHNSFEDNGIKFFSALGAKLPDSWEIDVEAALKEAPQWASSAYLGKSKRLDDAPGRYIEFCKSTFDKSLSLKGLKIVVDGAHGAAYHIAPKVFHELGADVIAIGCAPDGLNINKDVGATHPQALIDAVLSHKADVGIALDGDADRLQVVDAAGRMFNGDELLYMLARDRLQRGYSVPGVVGTLMTNMAVELAFRRLGVEMVRAKIGDRYVLEQLEQRGWLLGGESSGHLLALDIHTTGDGLISALQVLQAAVRTNDTLAGMLDDVHLFPQTLLNVKLKLGQQGWQSNIALQEGVAAVELELGDTGRVVIRASGTEPLLRVMVEAADAQQAQALAQRLADLV